MRLSDSYDVPRQIVEGDHSQPFRKFLWNWFGDTGALTSGELDLSFLEALSGEELEIARALIRRNLLLKHDHIIEGAAALGDVDAVPILRKMLETEADVSRRLVIAGALWNLARDTVFIACIDEAKRKGGRLLAGAHLLQILWVDDERVVDFLIDLLDQKDSFVRFQAHWLLGELELGGRIIHPSDVPHSPDEYRKLRTDPKFRSQMVASIRERNRKTKNGRAFGFRDVKG